MSNQIRNLAVSDTGFVFDPNTGHTYSVNTTGLAVLRGLKNGRTVRQIQDELANDFEEPAGVEDHVRQFMKLLVELCLLPQSELE